MPAEGAAPNVPTIGRLSYEAPSSGANGTIRVSLEATPAAPLTAALFRGEPKGREWLATTATEVPAATLTVEAAKLEPGQQYTVALTYEPEANPVVWSQATVLVFQAPVVKLAQLVDGMVELGWSLPAPTSIAAVSAAIWNRTTEEVVVSGSFTGTGGRLLPPVPLEPQGSYGVYVIGTRGVARGPIVWLASNLLLKAPTPQSVTYSANAEGGGFSVAVTPASPPVSPETATALLLRGGQVVAEASLSGESATIPQTQTLDPSSDWRVAMAYRNGVVVGPRGPSVAIPFAQPELAAASWDEHVFELAWTLPGCSGAAVSVRRTSDGVEVGSATVAAGSSTRIEPTSAIDPKVAYEARLAPIVGGARGLFGAGTALIVAVPSVTAVRCDEGHATVSLSGVAVPETPGGLGAVLELSSAGAIVLAAPAGTAGGTVALPAASLPSLSLAARCVGSARGVAGAVRGPACAAVPLLSGAPVLTSAVGSPSSCKLAWTWPGGVPTSPAPTAYAAVLIDGDQEQLLAEQPAPAEEATAPLSSTPSPGARIALRAIAGKATGPRSPATPIVTASPLLRSVSAAAGGAVVELASPAPPGERCLVSILDGGVTLGSAWSTGGAVAIAVESPKSGVAYTVNAVAAAAEGIASGPGASLQALLVAPTLGSPSFDGQTLSVPVTAPDAGGVSTTGYRVELLRDGVVVQSAGPLTPSEGKLVLAMTRATDPRASFAVRVTPLAASAIGPAAAVGAILAAPALTGAMLSGEGASRTVKVTVDGSGFPEGATLEAVAIADGVYGTPVAVTSGAATLPLPGSPSAAAVAARAKLDGATGPWSIPAAVPLTAPTVTARGDGATVSAWWNGREGTRYRVRVLATGTSAVVAESAVEAICATLPLEVDPELAYEVQVNELRGVASGPAGAVAVIVAAPVVTTCDFQAVNGSLKLEWQSVAGAGGYVVELTHNGTALRHQLSTTTLTLTASELPPPGAYELTVHATLQADGAGAAGPTSPPATVTDRAPSGVAARYDGRNAHVSWDALPGGTALAYTVTVLAGEAELAAVTATVTGTSATLAVPYEAATATSVVVQALTALGLGPPSQRLSLFAAGLYPSTQTGKAPYLVPAHTSAIAPSDVVVQLPQLFSTPPQPSELPTAAPFAMAAGQAPFAYTLTMASGSAVWSFPGEAIRAEVQTAYAALASALAPLHLTPLGWRTLQDAIARAMPQTFAETLLYACGFDPEGGYVDLVPGMVLRAEYQSYQYLGADAHDSDLLDGFLTTAAAEYEVGSYVAGSGAWLVGFDAFIARLAAAEGTIVAAPTVTPAGASGAGGVADLNYTQFRRPFCRLVYPTQLAAPNQPGSPQPAFNVALIACGDYPTLQAATENLRNDRPLGSGVAVTYLRGRSTVSPCLRVWVDGAPLVVPIGTTAGNVLESMARRPPVLGGLPLDGLKLVRGTGAAIVDPEAASRGYAIGSGQTIHLDWRTTTAYDASTDVLAVPLLPGDRLETGA